jgi:hypothetical protein
MTALSSVGLPPQPAAPLSGQVATAAADSLLANPNLTPLERAKLIAQQLALNPPAAAVAVQQPSGFLPSAASTGTLAPNQQMQMQMQMQGGGSTVDAKAALARARLIAMQMQSAPPADGISVPMHFSDELDINDYPIQVLVAFILSFRKYHMLFPCRLGRR